MKVADWPYYHAQDEVKPTDLHQGWPQELQELGPIQLPAGQKEAFSRIETSLRPQRIGDRPSDQS